MALGGGDRGCEVLVSRFSSRFCNAFNTDIYFEKSSSAFVPWQLTVCNAATPEPVTTADAKPAMKRGQLLAAVVIAMVLWTVISFF
jgi:hypothetical protein